MTFYGTIASADDRADLTLALRIEGVPIALVEREIDQLIVSGIGGYTQFAGITAIEEGESRLDMQERREIAQTLTLDLLDDSAGTLRALFAQCKRPLTWIAANATATSTSVTVASSTGMSAGQVLYTDQETMKVSSIGGGGALTVTRGDFASGPVAARGYPLFGTATEGQAVYTTPPNWVGRRAYLYGYTTTADSYWPKGFEQLLGTFIIDEAPKHTGDNSWSLVLAGVAQEYYERSVAVGIKPSKFKSITWTEGATATSSGYYSILLDNPNAFRTPTSEFPTYALLVTSYGGEEKFAIHEVKAALAGGIEVYDTPQFGSTWLSSGTSSLLKLALASGDAWPIQFVGGSSAAIPIILISDEGQQTLSSKDRLPGRGPTNALDSGWRFGAAFREDEVDIATWDSIKNAHEFFCVLDVEQRVSDILKEWCLLNGMATRVTVDGKLSVFPVESSRETSVTTLGANSIIPDGAVSIQCDETSITPIQKIQCNYSPFYKKFLATINMVDETTARRYRRVSRSLDVSFRMIGCNDAPRTEDVKFNFYHGANFPLAAIPTMVADIVAGEGGLGRRIVNLSLSMAHLALRIGDVVQFGSDLPESIAQLPDLRGNVLAGTTARVISRRPRYDQAKIDVSLLIMDPLLVICPAAIVASSAGATLTLSTTGIENPNASPAYNFYVNCGVSLVDLGAPSITNYTVTAIPSATQITISAIPAAAVGTRYVVFRPAGATADGTTQSGYTLKEMAITVDDSGVATANLSMTTEPRWR